MRKTNIYEDKFPCKSSTINNMYVYPQIYDLTKFDGFRITRKLYAPQLEEKKLIV